MIEQKVLVFGATSRLGDKLIPHLRDAAYTVVSVGRSKGVDYLLDPTSISDVDRVLQLVQPRYVINLIAETNVDKCEDNIPASIQANTVVPAIISKSIIKTKSKSIFFIHVSTDQVYSGKGNHHEANVGPINAYGSSKLAGELMVHYPKTAILRVNFYGMSLQLSRPSFTDWIVRSLRKNDQVTFFNNIRFNGVHHSTLCSFVEWIMRRELEGTYNLGCRDALSKADFAIALAQKLNLDIRNARIAEYSPSSFTANRPYDMTMNVKKIESSLNIACPFFQEEINKTAREYSNAEF